MNLLEDVINYVRRIVKTPSNASLSDNLIIDYINRFWLMDVDARVQLFDLKTKYQFQTVPGVDQYNMPLYSVQTQPGNQIIAPYPVYQGFMMPCYVNGIQVPFYNQRDPFFKVWPNYVQSQNTVAEGDGGTNYDINLPFFPALRGHVDIAGIISTSTTIDPPVTATFITDIPTTSVYSAVYITSIDAQGNSMVVADSGQFLSSNVNYGLLMVPGAAPFGNTALSGGYSTSLNTVNYNTGAVNVTFPSAVPSGTPINVQCYFYQQGIPRAILFYNNIITIRPPPDVQYLVEMDAYLSPAAFLSTVSGIPYGYMTEYLARGAARKILSDTGDWEQFHAYEPLFIEQERNIWKRSQRINTATRTGTIFSDLQGQSPLNPGQGAN